MRDEGESNRTIVARFTVVYKTDAPDDYEPELALDQLFALCPPSFVLTGRDDLMDDAYDMEAVGWLVETEEWGDMSTGEKAAAPHE